MSCMELLPKTLPCFCDNVVKSALSSKPLNEKFNFSSFILHEDILKLLTEPQGAISKILSSKMYSSFYFVNFFLFCKLENVLRFCT